MHSLTDKNNVYSFKSIMPINVSEYWKAAQVLSSLTYTFIEVPSAASLTSGNPAFARRASMREDLQPHKSSHCTLGQVK